METVLKLSIVIMFSKYKMFREVCIQKFKLGELLVPFIFPEP